MGAGSENALVMTVPQNLELVGIRRKSADVRAGREIPQVPGNLETGKFLRRLVLMLGVLNFLKIM